VVKENPMLIHMMQQEIAAGYLVNIRRTDGDAVPWGPDDCFDSRRSAVASA